MTMTIEIKNSTREQRDRLRADGYQLENLDDKIYWNIKVDSDQVNYLDELLEDMGIENRLI